MTTNRRSAGGTARLPLPPRSWARPPGLALLGLALVGLIQAGCRTGGCNDCGFGSRITNGVQALGARVFNHRGGGGGAGCGGGCGGAEQGTVYGDPGVTIPSPGGIAVPGPTILPPPAVESAPAQLEAIPGTSSVTPPAGSGRAPGSNATSNRAGPANGANRSAYEAYAPRNGAGRRRGSDVARAIHDPPESRPADAATPSAGSSDLLDHLPPVDLPSEVTRKATTPAPAAPSPDPASSPAPAPAETTSAAEGAAGVLPPIVAAVTRQAPGIRRSGSVAPSVAGGSAPSTEGLDWLKEKGYRTFVDLRTPSEIEPNFVDSVYDRGMVYISLPIVANRLDPSRLARFDDLIAQSDNRPLYFCDSDGSRAGLVWYIHLRTIGQDDAPTAAQKAEEIGLTDALRPRAEAYLAARKPRARPVSTASAESPPLLPEPKPNPSTEPGPKSALPMPPTGPDPAPASAGSKLPAPPKPLGGDWPQASTEPTPIPSAGGLRDPAAWKPVAALVLSGIGVPLAYWSRSAISGVRSLQRRASLPASARRSLDAPAGSGA